MSLDHALPSGFRARSLANRLSLHRPTHRAMRATPLDAMHATASYAAGYATRFAARHATHAGAYAGARGAACIASRVARLSLAIALGVVGAVGALSLRANEPSAKPAYDLVVRNARIIDGTGNPWQRGSIGVRGDRIVAVGFLGEARGVREIDAAGRFVAPGFIDVHSHSDLLLFEDGAAASKVRQGVTTEVLGEGDSPGPSQGKRPSASALSRGEPVRWTTLGGYFDAVERSGIAVNVASYVGLDNVWECVMGDSHRRPAAAELDARKQLIDEAMRDGARGLSTMLAMPPGSLATTDDLVELARVAARRGGIYSTHNRNEGSNVFDAVREAIMIGERAGIRVDIIHLKIADQQYWGRMEELAGLIQNARDRGIDVQANVYPYTRGNNDLASIIPPWAHEGGRAKLLANLRDPALRDRLKRDIRQGLPGWYNHFTAIGGDWSRMLVSGRGTYQGLTMDRVLSLRTAGRAGRIDELDELFELLIDQGGSVSTVYAHHTEEDMRKALTRPWCSVGSDGSALAIDGPLRRGNPHPRSFGTFPRLLGVYVRHEKRLSLEDAVRKMSSLIANKVILADRATIAGGRFADLVVFDAQTVIDRATYSEPFQYPEGISHVVVNGQLVLDDGQLTAARPGRALRGPGAVVPATSASSAPRAAPASPAAPVIPARPSPGVPAAN